MSTQRYISTSFWDDSWIQELDPSEKFMYLYLLTNPLTNIAGVYKITIRRICFDTGFNADTVRHILNKFEKVNKAVLCGEYMIIPAFPKNQIASEKIYKGITQIINTLPDTVIVQMLKCGYSFDLNSIIKQRNLNLNDDVSPENDTVSIPYDTVSNGPNYLNLDLNLNSNLDLNSDLDLNTKTQKKDKMYEYEPEQEPFEVQVMPENQKDYSQEVFDILFTNNLPCCNGNYVTFLMRDFKLGLDEIHRQRLHSQEVIAAVKNYAAVMNLKDTWWTARLGFSDLVKAKNIMRFLPGNFNLDQYIKKKSYQDSGITAIQKLGIDESKVEVKF